MPTIYQPSGRAREYASLACNVYRGCDHGCTYCYAPDTTQCDRSAFVKSQPRAASFFADLEREAAAMQKAGVTGQVHLCFTCDPYQTLDVQLAHTRRTIQTLHRHGLNVCVLTKGGRRALRDLDLFGPGDAFATTLTLVDADESRRWEPGAAAPQDRIETIRRYHEAGISTWVSLEPVLDPLQARDLIRLTHPFVDLYKVGKLNHHLQAHRTDWSHWARTAVALLESLGKPYYLKDDLLAFLPAKPAQALTLAQLDAMTTAHRAPSIAHHAPDPELIQLAMF